MQNLLPPRQAAYVLGISYSTLKLWTYSGKTNTVKTVAAITVFLKARLSD